ncbi:TetR/AcrR family transcriptional regulator [Myxococcota bacterium]|nr:TetR/AcrR family transcriptional regulator [Myxococcota bacterium]
MSRVKSQPPLASPVSSREKILDTAEALFARRGFDGVGLREVAMRSEMSKSALFHYFPGKADLYSAVLDRILGAVLEGMDSVPQRGSALNRLKGLVESIVDSLAASPTRGPLLLRSIVEGEVLDDYETPEADEKLARLFGAASLILTEGAASGELRSVPVPHALQGLVGLLVFHFASGHFGEELLGGPIYSSSEIKRFKEFVVPFTLNGLTSEKIED